MSKKRTKHELLLELGRTRAILTRLEAREATEISEPMLGVNALREHTDIGSLEQEHFWAIHLNASQRVLKISLVAKGSLAQVSVHPRDIFRDAVRMNAHSIILAHNHPSESPTPSPADLELTERMVEAGKLLGIPVLDHLVICRDSFVSIASEGLM